MQIQLCKYRLKALLFDVSSILWTFAFPVFLFVLYSIILSGVDKQEAFQTIPVGIVDSQKEEGNCYQAMKEAKTDDGKNLFYVSYYSLEEAEILLAQKEIRAYIVVQDDNRLFIQSENIEECIVKAFLQNYMTTGGSRTLENDFIGVSDMSKMETQDSMVIYFYALLAMSCLFCMRWGLKTVVELEANLSDVGAKIMVSGMPKWKIYNINFLAAVLFGQIELLLQVILYRYILNISFGKHLIAVYLVCFLGVIISVLLGALIGIIKKIGVTTKIKIIEILTFFGGIVSGVMFIDMKYFLDKNISFFGKISPANLIADAIYFLYRGYGMKEYLYNIGILTAEALILMVIINIKLRRIEYASI